MASSKQKEYERKSEVLKKAYEAGGPDQTKAGMEKAYLEFVVDRLALQRGLNSADPNVRKWLSNFARTKMDGWDPNEPALQHPAKMFRLLASNLDGSAIAYAEGLQTLRQQEESKRQSERASQPHRKHRLDEMLEVWVERNPELGPEEVTDRLRREEGCGVVIEVTKKFIEFYPFEDSEEKQQIKRVKHSGLGSRLTRIRKALAAAT